MHSVLEALPQTGLVRVAQGGLHVAGLLEVTSANGSSVVPVLCARSLFGVAYPARATDGTVLVMADLKPA